MERRWEEAWKDQRRLAEEYARFCRSQPQGLTAAERERIGSLAWDVPALWPAATTTRADRQRLVRLLVEEVRATVQDDRERREVLIRGAGGQSSRHELVRPVQRYDQLADYRGFLNRIDELRKAGPMLVEVAAQLNREEFRPPKRAVAFSAGIIGHLLGGGGEGGLRPRTEAEAGLLGADEWQLSALARHRAMPPGTRHRWIRVGWVDARSRLAIFFPAHHLQIGLGVAPLAATVPLV